MTTPPTGLPADRPPERDAVRQPNELDLRRIVRTLERRLRYRYVSPIVEPLPSGYRILSPCCSRNIDKEGGLIDIARLEYDEHGALWSLYRKDHGRGNWQFHDASPRLSDLMTQLNEDPLRVFWP